MGNEVFVFEIRMEKRAPKPYFQIIVDSVVYASGCAALTREDILDKMTQMLLQGVRADINEREEQREQNWRAT